MALDVTSLGEPKQAEFFGCASAAEANSHPAPGQQVSDRHLFSDIQRMVQVETDDRRPQANAPGLAGQVQSKQQGCGQVPLVCVVVVLGEPCVMHTELIGETDQVGHLIKNRRRGLIPGSFEMISQSDLEQTQVQCVNGQTIKLLKAFRACLEPSSPRQLPVRQR